MSSSVSSRLGLLAFVPAFLAAGCAPEAPPSDAPSVEDVALDEKDEGYAWGTWTNNVSASYQSMYDNDTGQTQIYASWGHYFSDSSSSGMSKGGGVCQVNDMGFGGCSADSDCGTNNPTAPSGIWHYCYQSWCYQRPGPPSTYCSLGQVKYANVAYNGSGSPTTSHILGCMTKDSSWGSALSACGTGGPSTYVRTVAPVSYQYCYYSYSYGYGYCN